MVNETICWNCARAIGKCSWSARLQPVKGWTATEYKATSSRPYTTYVVKECPGFIRDAFNGGLKRYPPVEKKGYAYDTDT